MKTLTHWLLPAAILVAEILLPIDATADNTAVLQQMDADHNGTLSPAEVNAGLRRQLGLAAGKSSPELGMQQALFKQVFGPGPNYPLQTLAGHPYFNPKIFGLEKPEPPAAPVDTVQMWVPKDKHPLKIRRTLEDLMEPDFDKARGALISYTNDFNTKSEQWSFHGIVGLNLIEEKNVHLGESPAGVRPPLDPAQQRFTERWFIPSVQWDKVTTSGSDTDEIDALISRLSTGFVYVTPNPEASLFDGYRFNFSGSYSTDSSGNRGIVAGEVDITPFKFAAAFLGLGLNGGFQKFGIFGMRPELTFHAEGGTVTNDGADPILIRESDFLRIGGKFGLGVRFEQTTKRFFALRGLMLHAGLDYYVDVTDSGPDGDLFTASADWELDPPKDENAKDSGHYTLSVEYRNGRAPLVLQRDNRITIGLGVKF